MDDKLIKEINFAVNNLSIDCLVLFVTIVGLLECDHFKYLHKSSMVINIYLLWYLVFLSLCWLIIFRQLHVHSGENVLVIECFKLIIDLRRCLTTRHCVNFKDHDDSLKIVLQYLLIILMIRLPSHKQLPPSLKSSLHHLLWVLFRIFEIDCHLLNVWKCAWVKDPLVVYAICLLLGICWHVWILSSVHLLHLIAAMTKCWS